MRRARGWLFRPEFESRIGYRKIESDGTPGYIYTFATRFVDGRGETIEERFEPVFVGLDNDSSGESEHDLALFADRRREVRGDVDVGSAHLDHVAEHVGEVEIRR